MRPLLGLIPVVAVIAGCSATHLPTAPQGSSIASPSLRRAMQPDLRFFNTPTVGAWPEYIVAGPQNATWFTELAGNIGRVTTKGVVTELPVGEDCEGITIGADGNVWFSEPGANVIGRITPQGVITSFPINAGNPDPRGLTLGPDGNVWFVEYYDGYIGSITPSGTISRFQIPQYAPSAWAIATGPDGDLWFTESGNDTIGRFDPRTKTFARPIDVPTQYATPWGIRLAPDKHVWFTEERGNKIGEVVGHRVREFPIRQVGSYPQDIAADSTGHLWFTEGQTGYLGRIDMATGKLTYVQLPSGNIPNGIAFGPNKNVWFTISSYTQPAQIGEAVLR